MIDFVFFGKSFKKLGSHSGHYKYYLNQKVCFLSGETKRMLVLVLSVVVILLVILWLVSLLYSNVIPLRHSNL